MATANCKSPRNRYTPISLLPVLIRKEELTQFYISVEHKEWKLDILCDVYESLRAQGAQE